MNDDKPLCFATASASATSPASAWLGKVLAIVLGAAAVTIGVMFSLLALVLLLIAGALVFSLILWKTRHWRRQWQALMRQSDSRQASEQPDETVVGTIIEGEVIHRSSESR